MSENLTSKVENPENGVGCKANGGLRFNGDGPIDGDVLEEAFGKAKVYCTYFGKKVDPNFCSLCKDYR